MTVGRLPSIAGVASFDRREPAMANAVTAQLQEPERALVMAQRAREALSVHTWAHVRSLWGKVYDNLLRISRRRAA